MKRNKKCSACGRILKNFLDLGLYPCADTFLKNKEDAIKLKKYRLIVGYCYCNHLTSIIKISPYERYKKNNYSYTSNNSPVSRSHFYKIADQLTKNLKLNNKSKVIEIGSNDGTFLRNIKNLSKSDILGVDPSDNMCKIATKNGVKSLNIFFDNKSANIIKKKFGTFDLLYGANVFNHIDDPKKFLNSCKKIVKKDGIIVLEVPDLDALFKSVGFDTIYHEHRQYFSKKSLKEIFRICNLKILKIEKIRYMSGSLRVFSINNNNKSKKIKLSTNLKKFIFFKKKISKVKEQMIDFVKKNKLMGKTVVGLGAATKGNTLLNYCKFNYKDIYCVLDNSKYKIGKFMPGSGITIADEKKIKNFHSVIILPWNITKHLYKKILLNSKLSYTSIAKIVKKL